MPNNVSRYLVAPKEIGNSSQQKMLDDLASIVERLPDASVIRRQRSRPLGLAGGATGDLEQLTISISPGKAEELKARFGHGLIIESDEPVKY
jgi:hypothetical protein